MMTIPMMEMKKIQKTIMKTYSLMKMKKNFTKLFHKLVKEQLRIHSKSLMKGHKIVMRKKVLKNVEENDSIYENARNSMKEITLLLQIDHPCVCKGIGINIQERTADGNTSIAIFTEFHPYELKKLLEIDILNNKLKTRIALEIAFGMRHIHSLGMIHRDLKIEKTMLNCIFVSIIIDLDLVHVSEESADSVTLTKGVGTIDYMSPEMLNNEDYDNSHSK